MDQYKAVIDILMTHDIDFRQVAINLAKSYPGIFIEMLPAGTRQAESVIAERAESATAWQLEIIKSLKGNDPVDALRILRQEIGCCLKEAKDVIDLVRVELYNDGIVDTRPDYRTDSIDLRSEHLEYWFTELCRVARIDHYSC
ncbi:hypothetical protein EBZ80_20865 [bacterium]|nr:hypothetical protein [bacterium]